MLIELILNYFSKNNIIVPTWETILTDFLLQYQVVYGEVEIYVCHN